jgi:hypothetical protein
MPLMRWLKAIRVEDVRAWLREVALTLTAGKRDDVG